MILYYITDRTAFPGDEYARRVHLLDKIAEAASAGVDYIQLREKDLSGRELESLASEAVRLISENRNPISERTQPRAALLVNSRTDIAVAIGAHGVHLPADDLSPAEIRRVWKQIYSRVAAPSSTSKALFPTPLISISCHSPAEVKQAAVHGATLALFAPIFGKKDAPGSLATGLESLREACLAKIPVLALGGITLQNADSCLEAGAAGIAAIRLFQENDISKIIRYFRKNTQ